MADYEGKFTGEEIDELLGKIPELESRIVSGGGSGGDKTYIHVQESPFYEWDVVHNLGKFPNVSVVEYYSNQEVVAEIEYINTNELKIRFSENMKGKAYLN